jgi:hypothetical protein
LEALDYLYSDETFNVDTTSANPARILRVPGTMNAKGDEVGDMKHRMARILEAPAAYEVVPKEKLEALAAMLPEPEQVAQSAYKVGGSAFDPVAYCQAHNLSVHHAKSWTDGSGAKCQVAVLDHCIFNPEHRLSAVIIGWPNGARAYRCRHNSCLSKHWKDAKAILEPTAVKHEEICGVSIKRADADRFEAEHPGCKIFNCDDDPKPNEISEEELEAYRMPSGPKFSCNLPADHFITRYIGYGKEISDAYLDYWLAGAIHELAVASDKKIKFVIKQDTIYTNLYIYIAGGSTLARKTTALKKSDNMILKVKGQHYLNTKVPNEFSPEAFIEHMDEFNHSSWVRDEAAGVLSLMKKDYMRGFKDTLMQLYDCTPITRMLRTSQRKADKTNFNVADPFLNVFFCSTDAALGANTELNDTLSGFLARFLFFFPQGEKENYMPLEKGAAAHSVLEEIVRAQLSEIAAKMDSITECVDMDYTPEARAYYNEWQKRREHELARLKDGFSSQIFGRLMPTVVKLAMLFELGSQDFDVNRPIRLEYFVEACRLVDEYFLPTARAVYDLVGSNAEKAVIDRIIAFLKRNGGKATRRAISRDAKIKAKELDEYISTMLDNGLAFQKEVVSEETGRKSTYIFLGDVSIVPNVPNVTNVPNVPKQDFTRETKGTLEQLETKETRETIKVDVVEGEEDISSPTFGKIDRPTPTRKEDPGFQKFKAGMKKRQCCLCGRTFPYDLTWHSNGDKSGYECTTCMMHGPPPEPIKADNQTNLADVQAT